jgi:hypothetical protein
MTVTAGKRRLRRMSAIEVIKQQLDEYADHRERQPTLSPMQTQLELGELLLSLLGVADRLKVDLLDAAEQTMDERAVGSPQLVRPRDDASMIVSKARTHRRVGRPRVSRPR